MFILIGFIVISGSVFGGFALSGGHLPALWQPLELLMIGGAAIGAFIAANGGKGSLHTLKSFPTIFKGDKYNKKFYLQLLSLLFRLTTKIKREGVMAVESDINDPHQSQIFTEYPLVLHNHHLVEFIQDYLRLMVGGTADFFQIENLMDNEIETHHHEGEHPIHAINRLADGMPAFGIVAAVMGVVHTMESVSLPPSELGILVAHALVGTFLGILLGYGFIGPLSTALEGKVGSATKALQCTKLILLATINNYAPSIAIEFGRKVLYSSERPSNAELEELMKELKSAK